MWLVVTFGSSLFELADALAGKWETRAIRIACPGEDDCRVDTYGY